MEESYLAAYIENQNGYNTVVDQPFANGNEEINNIDYSNSDDKDMLKDSLESIEESLDTIEEEVKPAETMEEVNGSNNVTHSNTKVSKNLKTEETQSERGKNICGNKKSQSLKPPRRDVIELNKINVSKGRPKGSYGNMYKQKLLNQKEQKVVEKQQEESTNNSRLQQPSGGHHESISERQATESLATANEVSATHLLLRNSVNFNHNYGDGGLQSNEKIDKNVSEHHSNRMVSNELGGSTELKRAGQQLMNGPHYLIDQSLHTDMTYRNENIAMNNLFDRELYVGQEINTHLYLGDLGHRYLPPVSDVLNSVRSAPADFETCHSGHLQYDIPYRPSSLCTFQTQGAPNLPQVSKHLATTGYSSIHAKKYTYEPYKLSDYKRLKQNATSFGGLGPNTNTQEFQEKMKKTFRQKNYAALVKEKHSVNKSQWRKKPILSPQDKNPKMKEANDRRKKALQYAKAVPKPTTTRKQIPQMKADDNKQEPQTLLDLLRQRHENERKAIDAVRKDLETKLKVKSK